MERKVWVEFELDGPGTESWDEVEVVVDFDFQRGTPAYISGPPEDCYEAVDDELTINSVLYQGKDVRPQMSEDNITRIEEQCVEAVDEDDGDPDPPYDDYEIVDG